MKGEREIKELAEGYLGAYLCPGGRSGHAIIRKSDGAWWPWNLAPAECFKITFRTPKVWPAIAEEDEE